jgi:hypothetical protein
MQQQGNAIVAPLIIYSTGVVPKNIHKTIEHYKSIETYTFTYRIS